MREQNAFKKFWLGCIVFLVLFVVVFVVNLSIFHKYAATSEELSAVSKIGSSISEKLTPEEFEALSKTQELNSSLSFKLDAPDKLWGNVVFVKQGENLMMKYNYETFDRIFMNFYTSLIISFIIIIPLDPLLEKFKDKILSR